MVIVCLLFYCIEKNKTNMSCYLVFVCPGEGVRLKLWLSSIWQWNLMPPVKANTYNIEIISRCSVEGGGWGCHVLPVAVIVVGHHIKEVQVPGHDTINKKFSHSELLKLLSTSSAFDVFLC